MARKLAISFDWQGGLDRERAFERVRIADRVGVDSVWIPEAWGRDCFTLLTQIAERTQRVRLGTGIVNIYSHTAVPAGMRRRLWTVGDVGECRERLSAEDEAGVDIHRVQVVTDDLREYGKTLEQLLI